ncbi:MAG: orotidine-5'-phosphate decarboxylase, partial [Bacteroidota bacterium]|nr:orotidine-5'-phosphate decarboxylase [Bacteroidota bacterium]
DIGNTAEQYAKTFFEKYPFDSITLSPYMGKDSIEPFLKYDDKWSIVLGLTSNKGAEDIQMIEGEKGKMYELAIEKIASWGTAEQLMFVVGATRPEQLKMIREMLPEYFFLVPGIGAQGGNLKDLSEAGFNSSVGLLVNASRSIIFAGVGKDFAEKAGDAAKKLQGEMSQLINTCL